ncbi:MAG: alpha/beta hydrolase [Pseudomonadota bacterium]
MTRAFWDRQFRFSEILPDFDSYIARLEADSASVSEAQITRVDYGDDPRQWIEWMPGNGSSDLLPVIVHGGYWRALEAKDHRFLMAAFADHGAHVANIEYRLMPSVRLEDLIADAQNALVLLAERFPTARFLLIGHSAGAHLALSAVENPDIAARTRGIIALSGVYDLAPVALSFLQDDLHLSASEILASTLHPSAHRPPALFVNGGDETHEFLRSGALMASQGRAAWQVIPDTHHMSLLWAATVQADALTQTVLQLEDITP